MAVYFHYRKRPICLACDQWTRVEDNLWAVHLTLEAMRGIDRWGAAELEATFTGYAALPAPAAGPTWWSILGVAATASVEEIRQAYRDLAKQHHPDVGGDGETFLVLGKALEQALAARS